MFICIETENWDQEDVVDGIVLHICYIVITIVAQNENQPGTVCSLGTVQFTDM